MKKKLLLRLCLCLRIFRVFFICVNVAYMCGGSSATCGCICCWYMLAYENTQNEDDVWCPTYILALYNTYYIYGVDSVIRVHICTTYTYIWKRGDNKLEGTQIKYFHFGGFASEQYNMVARRQWWRDAQDLSILTLECKVYVGVVYTPLMRCIFM